MTKAKKKVGAKPSRHVTKTTTSGIEKPLSYDEAALLLGITRTTLGYHIRKGRIRRAVIPGSARGRGVVAADVRAIVEGRAAV